MNWLIIPFGHEDQRNRDFRTDYALKLVHLKMGTEVDITMKADIPFLYFTTHTENTPLLQ